MHYITMNWHRSRLWRLSSLADQTLAFVVSLISIFPRISKKFGAVFLPSKSGVDLYASLKIYGQSSS